jgi:hypothetical protein
MVSNVSAMNNEDLLNSISGMDVQSTETPFSVIPDGVTKETMA